MPLSPAHDRARFPKGNDMARGRDTLLGAKHRRKRPYRGGRLLVWAGIATNGRTDLYVFAGGSVTAVRYRDESLHPLVRPFIAAMGTDAIFMDDNARPPARIEHDWCGVSGE
ncbi:hypothetical protein AVEN_252558-1 [Araneus ventricosus]|uniref:Uncharacterized protein n=1 Tax=Araneus ventricosus TaxID=182803 RepID=A0A4Y2ATA0_ARAVE|nr:hypothetical protein AVEN_252558-1 [Araneus ventricosus]